MRAIPVRAHSRENSWLILRDLSTDWDKKEKGKDRITMCGRAAQTYHAAQVGAEMMNSDVNAEEDRRSSSGSGRSSEDTNQKKSHGDRTKQQQQQQQQSDANDNYNMSPGMNAFVMWMENGKINTSKKVWGLVTRAGTAKKPLSMSMSIHFENLMFNARSDTLYTRPTFSRLANQRKSCLVALDGYFEWKASPLVIGGGGPTKGKKKQPYFVYASKSSNSNNDNDTPCLLAVGLWTKVSTGISDTPELDTFTIITTESNKQISWLHERMPLFVFDTTLGRRWLEKPSSDVLKAIEDEAHRNVDLFGWHMVTTDMSSLKYREKTAIKAVVPPRSVASFFQKKNVSSPPSSSKLTKKNVKESSSPNIQDSSEKQRQSANDKRESSAKTNTPVKRAKHDSNETSGLITSFFQTAKK